MKKNVFLEKDLESSTFLQNLDYTKRRKGWGFVEIGISLLIIGILSVSYFKESNDQEVRRKSRAVAEKMSYVHDAANNYIKSNFVDLINRTASGQIVVAAGRDSVNEQAPADSLQRLGFLPASYVDQNAFRQKHAVLIKRVTPEPPTGPALEALVTTYGGRPMDDGDLGNVANFIGVQGGFVPSKYTSSSDAGKILGAHGGWRSDISEWNTSIKPQAGYAQTTLMFENGHLLTDYLYRDDVGYPDANSMNVSINMKGNDLNNVNKIGGSIDASGNRVLNIDGSVNMNGSLRTPQDIWARDMHASRNLNVGDTATINRLNVTGATTVEGLTVKQNAKFNKDVSIDGTITKAKVDVKNVTLAGSPFFDGKNIRLEDMLPKFVAQYAYQIIENRSTGVNVTKPICRAGGVAKIMVFRQVNSMGGSVASNKVNLHDGVFASDTGLHWNVKWTGVDRSNEGPDAVNRVALAQTYCAYDF